MSVINYEEHGRQIYLFGDQQCKVSVYVDKSFRAGARAIVLVEDTNCSGIGRIAKALAKAARKPGYETAKMMHFSQKRRTTGDVFVTDGFGCGFKQILHAILPNDTATKGDEERNRLITKTYQNIFKTAICEKVDSVALALIGTGSNKPIDVRISALAFYESFSEFSMNGRSLSIFLVCFETDTMAHVCDVFDRKSELPPLHPPPSEIAASTSVLYESMDKSPPIKQLAHRQREVRETGLGVQPETSTGDDCVICRDKFTDPKKLKCGHAFCADCIDMCLKYKQQCPTCFTVVGITTGTQPKGTMTVTTKKREHCAGYPAYGRIDITYNFPDGYQGPEHLTPGAKYQGIRRVAYLPDNVEGRKVCEMLDIAFKRKLVFTIGNSTTTGKSGVITWNNIHHKTNPSPNTQFGYPDPGYLKRVTEELAAKGITEKDIED